MKETTKSYLSLVTLLIVLVIFVQINVLTIMIYDLKGSITPQKIVTKEEIMQTKEISEWKISIPKIDMVGLIEEGTCYGYKENYFSNLENLQQGDVICYQYGNAKKQYKVKDNIIIDQKDWSYLSSTKENKLTLITGVVNQPEKRRCVQAEEIL